MAAPELATADLDDLLNSALDDFARAELRPAEPAVASGSSASPTPAVPGAAAASPSRPPARSDASPFSFAPLGAATSRRTGATAAHRPPPTKPSVVPPPPPAGGADEAALLGDLTRLVAEMSRLGGESGGGGDADDADLGAALAALARLGPDQGGATPRGDAGGSSSHNAVRGGPADGVAAVDSSPEEEASVESLLGELEALGAGGHMAGVVDTVMSQLLSKEVLHAPLAQLERRYPPWLMAHGGALSAGDRARYTAQLELIRELCGVYDRTPGDNGRVMALLNRMQELGPPPPELVAAITAGDGDKDGGGGGVGLPPQCSVM